MRIGILSDIHDHVWNLRAALAALQDVDALLVAGDLCSPFVIPILADGYLRGPIHVVFGNNDGDRYRMTQAAQGFEHVELHGEVYRGRIGGRDLVMNHFPGLADPMDDRRAHLIVSGHDHRFSVARTEAGGWRLDPGTLLGFAPLEGADVPATYLVYDSEEDRAYGFMLTGSERHGAAPSAVPYRP